MNEVHNGLWVTDIVSVREKPTGQFETIITVCQDSVEDNVSDKQVYHHFSMADGEAATIYGGKTDYATFEKAVNTVVEAEWPVLVHCHHGQSRSVGVVTAALARVTGMQWSEAFHQVRRSRIQAEPDSLWVQYGQRYLEEYQ